jgi:hypothetical protein
MTSSEKYSQSSSSGRGRETETCTGGSGAGTEELSTTLQLSSPREQIRRGLLYTAPVPDKHGRAVMYLKIARDQWLSTDTAKQIDLLMYTVER